MPHAPHTLRPRSIALFIAALLCLAAPAFANAGAVMLAPIALHFLFGNVILGIIEGLLLAWIVRTRRVWLPILVMIPANFATFFAGLIAVEIVYDGAAALLGVNPLQAVIPAIIATVVVAFIITVILEWPACFFAMWTRARGRPRWWKALGACVVVNAATYTLLIAWYAYASDLTFVTQTHNATPAQVLADAPPFDLYCLTDHDRRVDVLHWDGKTLTRADPLSPPADARFYDQGLECRAGDTPGTAALISRDNDHETLVAEVPGRAPVLWQWKRAAPPPMPVSNDDLQTSERLWWTWWEQRSGASAWYPYLIRFNPTALKVCDAERNTQMLLRCVALPVIWHFVGADALPGDVLIVGARSRGLEDAHSNMIYALHIPTRRIAFLGYGRSPIAAMREAVAQPGDAQQQQGQDTAGEP